MKQDPIYVLFICLGNICRSPAAEGAFRKLVDSQNLSHKFFIDSCGTSQYHLGSLPHATTRAVAKERGIELTHRARQIQISDFEKFDYLLVMDKSNLTNVLNLAPSELSREKVKLFRDFEIQHQSSEGKEVPDPYYGEREDFIQVQEIVENASLGFLHYLKKSSKI